jgi:predicted Zn-dependent protease
LKRDPSSTATPVGARRAERSGRSKPLEKKQEPGDAIGQLFDLGHKLAKSADEVGQEVLGLSLEEEQQLGSDVHRLICQDQRVVAPPPVVQRLQKLTQPILELRSRKGLTYRFLVLGSPEVNAFAHVGGYVYVTQGMLGFVKTDAELQFILAHEIAHNDLRHVARQMTYAARASEVGGDAVGSVAQMAYMAIALGYSEDKEFEADAWAMRAMLKTGHGRAESLAAIRHLLAYVHEQKLETKRAAPRNAAERTWQQIEDHFNSHPPTEERARRLETLDADGNQG